MYAYTPACNLLRTHIEFPITAVINCHKFSGLKLDTFILSLEAGILKGDL